MGLKVFFLWSTVDLGFHNGCNFQNDPTIYTMKQTCLLLLAHVIALPFIGYVIHKHSPLTGNKVCAVPRTAYITGMMLVNQWPGWYRGFKHYAITTGLFTKENSMQVNNLTNAMGSCADEILTTLRVDEETIKYKELIKQIEDFFKVRRNILAERQKFNKRIQGRKDDGRTVEETIKTFINGLCTLAETCNYGYGIMDYGIMNSSL